MITENIKLAIFDFDDTLAIHMDQEYGKHRHENGIENYYKNAFEHPDSFYDEIEPCKISKDMFNLIGYLRLNNVKMYCLSGMRLSLHYDAKQYFINKYYGKDIKLLTAYPQEYKVNVVKILQKSFQCEPDEILFIDDNKKVVDLMRLQGYNALLVKEVKEINIEV